MGTSLDSAAPSTKASVSVRVAWFTIVLLFVGWITNYIGAFTITVALPLIGKTFALNKIEEGAVLTVFSGFDLVRWGLNLLGAELPAGAAGHRLAGPPSSR